MARNPIGFSVSNVSAGWSNADFDDVFVRKDCFLDGGLWVWGYNPYGQLGSNSIIPVSSPIQTISGGTNWRSVSATYRTTAAVKTDGTLWLWGRNSSGQLGNNSIANQSSPVQTVSGGTNWRSVFSGAGTTSAIKTDGSLWLWGANLGGILGNNSTVSQSSPIQTVSGGTDWKQTSSSANNTIAAIKIDGTLWAWGSNTNGWLGTNNIVNQSSPVQTVSGGTDWRSVSVGAVTAAIKTDGSLWLWGCNTVGAIGDNTLTNRSSPVQSISSGTDWKSVAVAIYHITAIKTDGSLWAWGRNNYGQLGIDNRVNQSSPVQTVSTGTNWKSVAASTTSTAAIKTDGSLWRWGYYTGNNTRAPSSSPVQTVSGGTNWVQATVGFTHSAAIREGCW